MKKNPMTFLLALSLIVLTAIILLYPAKCLVFSMTGLNLWFNKMIPALFPFMVLSGIMVRMNLTGVFAKIFAPVIKPIFGVRYTCIYVMVIGFLCGFPMGANVVAQLYKREELSYKEAEYLLSFCNNIGPVYFLSFALPITGVNNTLLCLIGMYGIPLLYGLLLRHTVYAKQISSKETLYPINQKNVSFLNVLDDSVITALDGITNLGGYMVFFNLLNIVPHLFLPSKLAMFGGCFLEITGGLQMLGNKLPVYSLVMLSFGGLSCLFQTYNMIKDTGLSVSNYLLHKGIITVMCLVFYGFSTP